MGARLGSLPAAVGDVTVLVRVPYHLMKRRVGLHRPAHPHMTCIAQNSRASGYNFLVHTHEEALTPLEDTRQKRAMQS